MRQKILYLLLLFFLFIPFLSGQQIVDKYHIPLKYLTVKDINARFDEANQQFKYDAIIAYTEEICQELNGSVLIARDSQIIVHKQVGYLRLEKGKGENLAANEQSSSNSNLITSSTLIEAASVSKQLTAAAILKLVEEKKLSLSDSLQLFFPQLPYKEVTLHHLLTHTSGIPEYIDFKIKMFRDTSKFWSNKEIVDLLIAQQLPKDFLSGEKFSYVNTNYLLLAEIVEKVAEMPFTDFIMENMFKPSGMKDSYYRTELKPHQVPYMAIGHLGNSQRLPRYFLDETIGDKGLYTTVLDLYLWGESLFSGKIISDSLLAIMTEVQNITRRKNNPPELYGYGLRIEENKYYGKLLFHGGLWRGFQNLFIYRPSDKFYIIFLSNFRNRAHYRKSDEYFHIWDGV